MHHILSAVFETAKYIEIVTEKVTGGELFDRIVATDHFSEAEAANVFVQVRMWDARWVEVVGFGA